MNLSNYKSKCPVPLKVFDTFCRPSLCPCHESLLAVKEDVSSSTVEVSASLVVKSKNHRTMFLGESFKSRVHAKIAV